MIRPLTAACMLLACGSGLYLYQVKHRTRVLDRQIEETLQAADTARQRSRVLQAEWTLLGEPQRLGELAARFLPLQTTQPGQFTTLAELDKRLPPVRQRDAPAQTTDQPPDAPSAGASAATDGAAAQPPTQPPPTPQLQPAATPVAKAEQPKLAAAGTAKPAAVVSMAASRSMAERTHEASRTAGRPSEHGSEHADAMRGERTSVEAAVPEPRRSGSLLGGTRLATAPPIYARATTQYVARLAPAPAAVYTAPLQPAGAPGYTQSALGMARTGYVAPFAGANYNVSNGN